MALLGRLPPSFFPPAQHSANRRLDLKPQEKYTAVDTAPSERLVSGRAALGRLGSVVEQKFQVTQWQLGYRADPSRHWATWIFPRAVALGRVGYRTDSSRHYVTRIYLDLLLLSSMMTAAFISR